MKRSTDRILTTHVSSLPRPDDNRPSPFKEARGDHQSASGSITSR
jgi:hypothetical protein